jgi:hypothetical protein
MAPQPQADGPSTSYSFSSTPSRQVGRGGVADWRQQQLDLRSAQYAAGGGRGGRGGGRRDGGGSAVISQQPPPQQQQQREAGRDGEGGEEAWEVLGGEEGSDSEGGPAGAADQQDDGGPSNVLFGVFPVLNALKIQRWALHSHTSVVYPAIGPSGIAAISHPLGTPSLCPHRAPARSHTPHSASPHIPDHAKHAHAAGAGAASPLARNMGWAVE